MWLSSPHAARGESADAAASWREMISIISITSRPSNEARRAPLPGLWLLGAGRAAFRQGDAFHRICSLLV